MDEIKSVFINIYWFGAASPAAETMTAHKVNGRLQDQGGR